MNNHLSAGRIPLVVALGFMGIIAAIILLIEAGQARYKSDDAKTALERAGYTDVVMTGFAPLACEDADVAVSFTAQGPEGAVKGTACCGLVFKGCEIRW
jgi:hypothetical protein